MIAPATAILHPAADALIFTIPRFRLERGENNREHWAVRAKRVAHERWRVNHAWAALARKGQLTLPSAPWTIKMFRCSPKNGLDYVNLVTSFKGVQDQITEELRLRDDRDAKGNELDRAEWDYLEDTHTPWAVRIEIRTRTALNNVGPVDD